MHRLNMKEQVSTLQSHFKATCVFERALTNAGRRHAQPAHACTRAHGVKFEHAEKERKQ